MGLMEILYSIFIGIIVGMIAVINVGVGLQCRRDKHQLLLLQPVYYMEQLM